MKYIRHIILCFACLLMLFPFTFVIIGATNDSAWFFSDALHLKFGEYFIVNLNTVIERYNILGVLLTTLLVSLCTTFLSLIILTSSAYVFNKYEFKGKKFLEVLLLTLILIPSPTYLIGQLETINGLNLYSTFLGLVLPFVINIRVFLYLQSVMIYIPNNLIKAAKVDGAGDLKTMFKVSLPCILDKITLAGFMIFLSSWNNFLIPMIITTDSLLFTLPVLISAIADPMTYDIGAVFMSLLFNIIPVLLLFSMMQKIIFKKEKD